MEDVLPGCEDSRPPLSFGENRAVADEKIVGEYSWVLKSNSDFGGLANVSNMEGNGVGAKAPVERRQHRDDWLGNSRSRSS